MFIPSIGCIVVVVSEGRRIKVPFTFYGYMKPGVVVVPKISHGFNLSPMGILGLICVVWIGYS